MTEPLVLVLDVGTTALKASLVSAEGVFVSGRSCPWGYDPVPGVPGGLSFAPEALLAHFQRLTTALYGPDETLKDRVAAVTVSAQRLGFVFLSASGAPLVGIPNIDRRAAAEAAVFQGDRYEAYYPVTGRWPGPQHLVSRLRWWRAHAPEEWRAVGRILSISDWLVFALCGVMASEPTTACESGLMDVRTLTWAEDILAEEKLPRSLFGDLTPPGTPVGVARGSAAEALGLRDGVPVAMGAGDTQLGVLGAGGLRPGDCAVVAGTSAPVNLVTDAPKVDAEFRTVVNPYVVPGAWVMEANAMLTGVCFTWIKDLLFGDAADGYAALEALARDYMARTETLSGFTTVAGASTADTRRGNLYPNGVIGFPMNELNAGALTRGAFAFSAFEAAADAILCNVEIVSRAAGRAPERLCIGGGETRMSLWVELIRLMTDLPVQLIEADDMTSLGAAILAFVGTGIHPNYGEAVRKMVGGREAADPAWLRARPFAGTLSARKDAWAASFDRYRIR